MTSTPRPFSPCPTHTVWPSGETVVAGLPWLGRCSNRALPVATSMPRTRESDGYVTRIATIKNAAAGRSARIVRRTLGIDDGQELVAPSPFDYGRQARLFIAPAAVNPKSPEFARRAAPLVEECLDRSRGRAFVLFTSYARLREVYGLLRERLADPGFASALSPLERAELELLAAAPLDFVSCTARRAQKKA